MLRRLSCLGVVAVVVAAGCTRSDVAKPPEDTFRRVSDVPDWIADRGANITDFVQVGQPGDEGFHLLWIDDQARVAYTERCADGAEVVEDGGPYGPSGGDGAPAPAYELRCLQ